MAPFTPTEIIKFCPDLASPRTAHALLLQQPHKTTRPLLSVPPVGPSMLTAAIGKLIDDLAKRFYDTYTRHMLIAGSSSNNKSSIATEGQSTGHPPRKHAAKKKHKHDKKDP